MKKAELSQFLKTVESGDFNAVSAFLQGYMQEEHGSPPTNDPESLNSDEFRSSSTELASEEPSHSRDDISPSDWLEAVWIAETNSFIDIKKILFECKVLYQKLNKGGWNILQETMAEYVDKHWPPKQLQKIEILLRSRLFDLNSVTNQQETILHLVSKHAYTGAHLSSKIPEIVDLLIENGIEVNRKNASGRTALMIACERGSAEIVEQLLNWRKRRDMFLISTQSTIPVKQLK